MGEIENTMCRERKRGNPEGPPETSYRGCNEDGTGHTLKNECMCGSAHGSEQRIVGRDHDGHDRIEGPVAVEADARGEEPDSERKYDSDE